MYWISSRIDFLYSLCFPLVLCSFVLYATMLIAIEWLPRLLRELDFVEQLGLLVWISSQKNLKLVMQYLFNNIIILNI
jgi:hypothetical protein